MPEERAMACRAIRLCRMLILVVVPALALVAAPAAQACSIDGIASLSENGNVANLSGTPPSGTDLRRWAPFTLLAAAPGDVVHLAESTDKLLGTLPMWAFSHPFQWRFDDGATAAGTSVTHRFITLGWHSFSVSYYWPARKRWVQFDSARLQIVTAGDLWKANLGYNVGKVFQIVVRLLIWATLAGLVVLAVWRWRWASARRCPPMRAAWTACRRSRPTASWPASTPRNPPSRTWRTGRRSSSRRL
jgi:hypothetical protein